MTKVLALLCLLGLFPSVFAFGLEKTNPFVVYTNNFQDPVLARIGVLGTQNVSTSTFLPVSTLLSQGKTTPVGMIARLDYVNQRELIKQYLRLEVPFVTFNVPEVNALVQRWTDEYLLNKFEEEAGETELGPFMRSTFSQVFSEAASTGAIPISAKTYSSHSLWLNDELPSFARRLRGQNESLFWFEDEPSQEPRDFSFRVVPQHEVLQPHYDHERTFLAVVRGYRRIILAPPSECPNLYIQSDSCTGERRSKVDWEVPDLEKFPRFADAVGLAFDLSAGEVVFMPSFWTHYIASESKINLQVMVRAGYGSPGVQDVSSCRGEPEIVEAYSRAEGTIPFMPQLTCAPKDLGGVCTTFDICVDNTSFCYNPTDPVCISKSPTSTRTASVTVTVSQTPSNTQSISPSLVPLSPSQTPQSSSKIIRTTTGTTGTAGKGTTSKGTTGRKRLSTTGIRSTTGGSTTGTIGTTGTATTGVSDALSTGASLTTVLATVVALFLAVVL